METNEIIEGNKLIAEFMYPNKREPYYIEEHRYIDVKYGEYVEFDCFSVEEMKYHSSWDWLMPVINKIVEMNVYYEFVDETFGMFGKDDLVNTKYIIRSFENVIEFIKWYNSHETKN